MYAKGSITAKQIQSTVDNVDTLNLTNISSINTMLARFVESLPRELTEHNEHLNTLNRSITSAQKLFVGLHSEHFRLKHFTGKGLVLPQSYKIGRRVDYKPDGTSQDVAVEGQYIPITDTLRRYRQYYETISAEDTTSSTILSSYLQTDRCATAKHGAVKLILYHDDIECGNVLGSRAGVYKLTMFYFSGHNQSSSNLRSIHLAIVCHASDVKTYGYAAVLSPLLSDLSKLSVGLDISDGANPIFASLEHIVGDNLAANAILGMNQSFSAGHYCRFCYVSGADAAISTHSHSELPRSRVSHQFDVECVEALPSFSTKTGVKERCVFDELPYFSGVEATVPDIM